MVLKRSISNLIILILILPALASACELEAIMVNQDPYPAVPGDYVTAVFQIKGVSDVDCGLVSFTLNPKFPFSLDSGISPEKSIIGGTYSGTNFKSFLLAPYKIRVDSKALDGDNDIEAILTSKTNNLISSTIETFKINVEATDTDFEISVKNYDELTKIITFDILNVGKNDIEALTIEIPKQEKITIKGSNRNIVGSLDSNEDTTFSFEANPKNGEIEVNILYTDKVNVRRELKKKVEFDSEYFTNRESDNNGMSFWFYFSLVLIIFLATRWYFKQKKSKKQKHLRHSKN